MADPTFTIYTLGEIGIFEAALTGVAMLFNPTNTELWVSSSSALGLGALAGLGLLITLFIMLLNGVMTQKFELGTFVMLIIVYSILFVPKFKVQIEDIYSGSITAVDGIPLGVAVPASLVSNGTYEIAKNLEVAFSTIQGNYVSLSTEGFVSPLRLLNQLRMGNKRACSMGPDLCATIHTAIQDCLVGRTFDFGAYNKSTTSVDDVTDYLKKSTGGITMFYGKVGSPAVLYPYPNGKVVNCSDAGAAIENAVNAFMTTPDATGKTEIDKLLNMSVKSTGSGNPYTKAEYDNAFAMMNGVSGTEADAFMKTALFAPTINNAAFCANNAATHADLSKCMPMISAVEQWKEDSAAGGTMFTRVMVHGMNIMLFMFYVFAPVIAVVIVAVGVRGLKIAGSYLMFGIWTQTWLPVAAMVNFYLQVQVEREVSRAKASGVSMFTPEGMYTFYDMLSTKVAMAGDMMASVPLISLGLMSGSMYAVTSIAQRMGGKDYYDEKVNTPSLRASAPLHAPSAGSTSHMGNATVFAQGGGDGVKFGTTASTQTMVKQAEAAQHQSQERFGKAAATSFSDAYTKTKDASKMRQLQSELAAQGQTQLATGLSEMVGAAKAVEKADQKVKELQTQSQVQDNTEHSGTAAGGAMIAGTGGQFAIKKSHNSTSSNSESNRTAMAEALKLKEDAGARYDLAKQKVASLSSKLGYTEAKAVRNSFQEAFSKTDSTQLSASLEQVQSTTQSAERAKQFARSMSSGIEYTAGKFTSDHLSGKNPAMSDKLTALSQNLMNSDKEGFDRAVQSVSQGDGRLLTPAQKNQVAAAYYHMSRGTEEGASLVGIISGSNMDVSDVTKVTPGSTRDVAGRAGAAAAEARAGAVGPQVSTADMNNLIASRQRAIEGQIGSGGISKKFSADSKGVFNDYHDVKDKSDVGWNNYGDVKHAINDVLQANGDKFSGGVHGSATSLQNLSNFLDAQRGSEMQMDPATKQMKNELATKARTALTNDITSGREEIAQHMSLGHTNEAERVAGRVAVLENTQKTVAAVFKNRLTQTANNIGE